MCHKDGFKRLIHICMFIYTSYIAYLCNPFVMIILAKNYNLFNMIFKKKRVHLAPWKTRIMVKDCKLQDNIRTGDLIGTSTDTRIQFSKYLFPFT